MTYCLCALIIIMPLITLYAYRLGAGQAKEIKDIRITLPHKTEKREPTEAEIILRNIENYNGSKEGQVKL